MVTAIVNIFLLAIDVLTSMKAELARDLELFAVFFLSGANDDLYLGLRRVYRNAEFFSEVIDVDIGLCAF